MLGLNLWPDDVVDAKTKVIHHPKQNIWWTAAQTEQEKYEYLKIDLYGNVEVDLKMAKITAEGSFKYIQDR